MIRFNFLFALAVVVIFSVLQLSQVETVDVQTIAGLILFALLIFSFMGMADTHVVKHLRQRYRRNLLYALAPLAVLYTLTIAYLALVGQMTNGNLIHR